MNINWKNWQLQEENQIKKFYELGLKGKVLKIWQVLEEYKLDRTGYSWFLIKDIRKLPNYPGFILFPLNVENFWEKNLDPKILVKLIEEKIALPVATTIPLSYKNQPYWIHNIIETTVKTYGFYPPCTQWRYEAYVSGLKKDSDALYYFRNYLGEWGYKILVRLGVDPKNLVRDTREELECRYTLAIVNNLRLIGLQDLIEKAVDAVIKIEDDRIKRLKKLRNIINEPYTIFVSPLRTHLGGLKIHELTKEPLLFKAPNLLRSAGKTVLKIPIIADFIKNKDDLRIYIEKITKGEDYENYGKQLYNMWKEVQYKGYINKKTFRTLSDISEKYYDFCIENSKKYIHKLKLQKKIIKFLYYTISYTSMGISVITPDISQFAVAVLLQLLTRQLGKQILKEKEIKNFVINDIKKVEEIKIVPKVIALGANSM